MTQSAKENGRTFAILLWCALIILPGCAKIRLPAIDPSGNRIFLPPQYSDTLLGSRAVRNPFFDNRNAGDRFSSHPTTPAFNQPHDPALCANPNTGFRTRHLIPRTSGYRPRGKRGEMMLTPARIIAPVGSEVVVLSGICGGDGFYVLNQPLEWMLSNDSVGQFIEVGGMEHSTFNRIVPPTARKFDGQYAWGRTGLKERLVTRGTPTPVDDIQLLKGQAYTSVSSASEGTSYITCVAPKAEAWDKRRKSTIIHWIDALWAVPLPTSVTAGSVHPLTTAITRSTNGSGVEGWKVRYTIVGGAPAEFAPTGSQTAEVLSGADGRATVQMRQLAGKLDPGTTQIRVDVIRPRMLGEQELTVESGVTSVKWSAPALTIRAIGPKSAGIDEAFNYRIEVTNPGDQLTRGVVLSTKNLSDDLEFISSEPKPTQYGREYQWELGDVPPGAQPRIVNIQLKSKKRGNSELCFEVSSQTDRLKTDACATTEIAAPCVGLEIEGPTTAKVGTQIEYAIVIANQCDEPLENVRVEVEYDAGLKTDRSGTGMVAELGVLEFGDKRSLPLLFDVVAPGTRCFNLRITADGGHTARARRCVEVSQDGVPAVELKLTGQRRIEKDQMVLIEGLITNNGTQPLYELAVVAAASQSLVPEFVTDKYQYKFAGDEIVFTVGQLDPGESALVTIKYEGAAVDGDAYSELTVSSRGGALETRRYELRVEPTGTLGNAPALPGNNTGPQIPRDTRPDNFSGNTRQDLKLTTAAIEPSIRAGGRARVEFLLENNSQANDGGVEVKFLVPTGLKLVDIIRGGLGVERASPDDTQFWLTTRQAFRAGERLSIVIEVEGRVAGDYIVEAQVTSDNSTGAISSSDRIIVTQ